MGCIGPKEAVDIGTKHEHSPVLNSSGRMTMSAFMYRLGEGAGLAAVLASVLLWANLAEAWLR
jgi:hypothetical protein